MAFVGYSKANALIDKEISKEHLRRNVWMTGKVHNYICTGRVSVPGPLELVARASSIIAPPFQGNILLTYYEVALPACILIQHLWVF